MNKQNEPKNTKFYMFFEMSFFLILFTLALFVHVYPDREYSVTEKRPLAGFPSFSIESVADGTFMNATEDWLADQFPFRDQLMQVKSQINIGLGGIRSQNVYRCYDGSLMEAFSMPSEDVLLKQSEAITNFATRYPDSDFYFCLVPNAISVLVEKLPEYALTDDQNLYVDYMKKEFSYVGTFIDLRDVFEKNKDKTELFYHTDHHWTTDAAYLAWQSLYSTMDLENKTSYTSGVVCNTFLGSLISASGFSAMQYDSISLYMPEENPIYTVTYVDSQTMTASLYSMKHLNGDDPYEVFFGGNHPQITIKTGVDTTRSLLIIKDSYANCLIPFLLSDFSQITIIDARYYYDDLNMEMQSAEYSDVLFLYNVNTLSKDNTLVPVLGDID